MEVVFFLCGGTLAIVTCIALDTREENKELKKKLKELNKE